MPRKLRAQSPTDIYHVMLRGVNKQQIFFDDDDNRFFMDLLSKYKSISGYKLYAFCLMGNHIHLLIHVQQETLDTIMRRIEGAFVYWYNVKYERVGHLFQDRYRSEPVTDEKYFFAVLRYILRNPVKAGFCAAPEDYKYSSGGEYLRMSDGITDTDFTMNMMGIESLKAFIMQENNDQCLEISDSVKRRLTDDKATGLILHEFGTLHPAVGLPKDRKLLNSSLCNLVSRGISIRQLSRLTGISKAIIEDAVAKNK